MDVAQRTKIDAFKGRDIGRIGFRHIAAIQHRIVHGDQYAASGGLRIRSRDHRVIQIKRAIGAHCR